MDRVAAGPAIQSSACEVACQSPEEAADAQTRATAVKSSSYDMAVKAIESRRHYNPGQHEEGEVSEGSRREGSAGRSQYQNKPARDPLCEASVTDSGCIDCLPNEVLIHVLQFLDVSDLLATSRVRYIPQARLVCPESLAGLARSVLIEARPFTNRLDRRVICCEVYLCRPFCTTIGFDALARRCRLCFPLRVGRRLLI